MNDAERRDKLDNAIFDGEKAEQLLKQLDPAFEKIGGEVRDKIITQIRAGADKEDVYQSACLMAAVDELYGFFHAKTVTKDLAKQEAEKIQQFEAARAVK